MQLKTKLFAPLVVLLMMGMANSAYASLVCAASAVNVRARDTINNVTAVAGDIVLTCTATDATPTTDAQITINYGVAITNSRTGGGGSGLPVGHAITLVTSGAAGTIGPIVGFDTSVAGTQGAGSGIQAAAGQIFLLIPAFTPTAGGVGTVTVGNVLLSVAGAIVSGGNVRANINVASQNNTVSITNAPVEVITQVLPSINSTTAAPGLTTGTLTAQFTSTGGTISATRSNFSVVVTEGYIDAWRTPADYYLPKPVQPPAPGVANNGTN
jgi:hypothetical protein